MVSWSTYWSTVHRGYNYYFNNNRHFAWCKMKIRWVLNKTEEVEFIRIFRIYLRSKSPKSWFIYINNHFSYIIMASTFKEGWLQQESINNQWKHILWQNKFPFLVCLTKFPQKVQTAGLKIELAFIKEASLLIWNHGSFHWIFISVGQKVIN